MRSLRTKIIYFAVPFLILVGALALVGYVNSEDNSYLKPMAENLTKVSLDPPNDVNFAGELVPTRDFEVKERLDKELIRYIFYHSATIVNIKRANRWKGVMSQILKENGIPSDFFYLCVAESHLANATSPVGAKGYWQFMPETGKLYGLEISDQVDERLDPIKATRAACDYLKDAHRRFRNWTLVAASYNMGVGGVSGQLNRQKVDNYYDLYLNAETAAYVFRILALKTILENPEDYGFTLRKDQLYSPLRYKEVEVTESIESLVDFALEYSTTYKMVKVLNPWLLKDKLDIPEGKSYIIKLPLDSKIPEGIDQLLPTDSLGTDSLGKVTKPDSMKKDSGKTNSPTEQLKTKPSGKTDTGKTGKTQPDTPKVKTEAVKESKKSEGVPNQSEEEK